MTTQGVKRKLTAILSGLVVKADRMRKNLHLVEGLIIAERLILRLFQKTGKKQIAYRIVNKAAMEALEQGETFIECLIKNPEIQAHLSNQETQNLHRLEAYLGLNDLLIDRVIKNIVARW